jgi:hypothetical protein
MSDQHKIRLKMFILDLYTIIHMLSLCEIFFIDLINFHVIYLSYSLHFS